MATCWPHLAHDRWMPLPANMVCPLYVPFGWRKEIFGFALLVINVDAVLVDGSGDSGRCAASQDSDAVLVKLQYIGAFKAFVFPV